MASAAGLLLTICRTPQLIIACRRLIAASGVMIRTCWPWCGSSGFLENIQMQQRWARNSWLPASQVPGPAHSTLDRKRQFWRSALHPRGLGAGQDVSDAPQHGEHDGKARPAAQLQRLGCTLQQATVQHDARTDAAGVKIDCVALWWSARPGELSIPRVVGDCEAKSAHMQG